MTSQTLYGVAYFLYMFQPCLCVIVSVDRCLAVKIAHTMSMELSLEKCDCMQSSRNVTCVEFVRAGRGDAYTNPHGFNAVISASTHDNMFAHQHADMEPSSDAVMWEDWHDGIAQDGEDLNRSEANVLDDDDLSLEEGEEGCVSLTSEDDQEALESSLLVDRDALDSSLFDQCAILGGTPSKARPTTCPYARPRAPTDGKGNSKGQGTTKGNDATKVKGKNEGNAKGKDTTKGKDSAKGIGKGMATAKGKGNSKGNDDGIVDGKGHVTVLDLIVDGQIHHMNCGSWRFS